MTPRLTNFRFPGDTASTYDGLWRAIKNDDEDSFRHFVALMVDRDRALEDYTSLLLVLMAKRSQVGLVETTESTASGTYTDLATVGPEITVEVGETGRVLLTAGAYVNLTGGSIGAQLAVYVDGALTLDPVASIDQASGVSIAANIARTTIVTGLSSGAHTFKMKYKQAGGTAYFAFRHLIGVPF